MLLKILALAAFVAATSASPKDFHEGVLVSLLRLKVVDACPRDYAACVAEPDCNVGINLALQDFLLHGGSTSDISGSFRRTDLYKCADAKDVFSSFDTADVGDDGGPNMKSWYYGDGVSDFWGYREHDDDDEVDSDQYLAFFELLEDEAECPKHDETYALLNLGERDSTTGEYAKKFDFDDEDAERRAVCLNAGCLLQTIKTPLLIAHFDALVESEGSVDAAGVLAGLWGGDDMDLSYARRNVSEGNYKPRLQDLFLNRDDDDDYVENDLAFYGDAPSCGCETGTFFTHSDEVTVEECDQELFYSYDHCEACGNFMEASDCASASAEEDGLPAEGAEECAKVCFGGKARMVAARAAARQAVVDKVVANGGFEHCFPLDFAAKLAQTGFSYDKFKLKDAECNALQGDPAACELKGCASNEVSDEYGGDDDKMFASDDYTAKFFGHIQSFAEEAGMSSAEFQTKHFHECDANRMTAGIVGDETVDDYDDFTGWGDHSEQYRKHALLRSACDSVLAEVDDDNNGNDDALPEWWYDDDDDVLREKRCDATPGCSMQHVALPKAAAFEIENGFEAFYSVMYAAPAAKQTLRDFGDMTTTIMSQAAHRVQSEKGPLGYYSDCTAAQACPAGQFCAVECFQGPCEGSIAEGTMADVCQPCVECEGDSDAVGATTCADSCSVQSDFDFGIDQIEEALDQMGQLAAVATAAALWGSTGVTNYPALFELEAVKAILTDVGMPDEALPAFVSEFVSIFEQMETDQKDSAAQQAKSVCSDDYESYGPGVNGDDVTDCNRGVPWPTRAAYSSRKFCSNDYSLNPTGTEPGRCMTCPTRNEYDGVPDECACKLTHDDTTSTAAGACLVECFGMSAPGDAAARALYFKPYLDECPSTKKEAIRVDWDFQINEGGSTECLPDNYAKLSAQTGFSVDKYITKELECTRLGMTESDCVARDCEWGQDDYDDDDDGWCEADTGRHGIVGGAAVSPAQRAAQKDFEEKTEAMALACVDPKSTACADATVEMKQSLQELEAAVPKPAFNAATGLSASLIAAVVAAAATLF